MPEYAPEQTDAALQAFDRRAFIKLMGASLALAGGAGAGCTRSQPLEKIVPYVRAPEHVIPGVPAFYATSLPSCGFAGGFGKGAVVEQHEGRPTKIEGNPDHPSSLGGTDIFMQASILQLYDPDRSKGCRRAGEPATWGGFLGDFRRYFASRKTPHDVRVRLLTSSVTSPSVAAQIARLRRLFPQLRHYEHAIPGSGNARRGQQLALGKEVTTVFDFTKARRIVSFDAHFLADGPGNVRYSREFSHLRRSPAHPFGSNQTHRGTLPLPRSASSLPHSASPPPLPASSLPLPASSFSDSRLYVAESSSTYTGACADHYWGARPSVMPQMVLALAKRIAGQAGAADLPAGARAWVEAAADDLLAHRGESLVLAGEYLSPDVHALVHGINALLDGPGKTVSYLEAVEMAAEGSLGELVADMDAGDVDLLMMLDVNPAYAAAGDLNFAEALKRFAAGDNGGRALHMGGYVDETAELCGWHVPLSHALEAWGDLRGHDGTAGIVQPLIEPLWESKSAVEILGALAAVAGEAQGESAGDVYRDGYDRVRALWMGRWQEGGDSMGGEMRWRKSLRDGVIEGTAARAAAGVATPDMAKLMAALEKMPAAGKSGIEIAFRPDPTVGDGEWANHAWLQELPKPLTRVTWETVALISAEDARELGIAGAGHAARETTPGVRVTAGGRSVEMPAWVQPGQARGVVTLYLGGGRRSAGSVQENVGVDVYPLMRGANVWSAGGPAGAGVQVVKAERRFVVAATQTQQAMEGRAPARQRRLSEVAAAKPAKRKVGLSLYPAYKYEGYKWGMVIDLSACTGCQACVIACQAENNIPTVGKEQVLRGREMHWMRIDTYVSGQESGVSGQEEAGEPRFIFQPMLCQHCENAPCEVVCPVEATSHSEEGINEMTYNRCIGTRYCSNNCPYKVRRFNFLAFNEGMPHNVREGSLLGGETAAITLEMQRNPNVTVRTRGVMEKCTYCVQRVNRARIAAKREWGLESSARGARGELRENASGVWGWFGSGTGSGIEMRVVGEAERAAGVKELPRIRVQTACQQACPTEAIYFGDLNDADAVVAGMKGSGLNYGVLAELNTEPRTTYLERVVNPNTALGGGA